MRTVGARAEAVPRPSGPRGRRFKSCLPDQLKGRIFEGIPSEVRPFDLCAQHGRDLEVKVLWGSWSQRPRANRKAPTVRGALKEAGSGAASRRTGIGYEPEPSRASGQVTAK